MCLALDLGGKLNFHVVFIILQCWRFNSSCGNVFFVVLHHKCQEQAQARNKKIDNVMKLVNYCVDQTVCVFDCANGVIVC